MSSRSRRLNLGSLPVELQAQILTLVYCSVVLHSDYTESIDGGRHAELQTFRLRNGSSLVSEQVPIYQLDSPTVRQLIGWGSLFAPNARVRWESCVTFHFPSTVAMLDVLLGPLFTTEQRSQVRHIDVIGTPVSLDLDEHTGSTSYLFHDILPHLTGLNLHTLTYHEHLPARDPTFPSTAAAATTDHRYRPEMLRFLQDLSTSPGWKRLTVLSPNLRLSKRETNQLFEFIDEVRASRKEDNFQLTLPTTALTDKSNIVAVSQYISPATAAVYTNAGPGARNDIILGWRTREVIVMTVTQTQHTSIKRNPRSNGQALAQLLQTMTWHEIRKKGDYLLGEGRDGPYWSL